MAITSLFFGFLLLCLSSVTRQQCPIGYSSFNKCVFVGFNRNFFDAEVDCKRQAASVGADPNNAFLVSIPNAFENTKVQALTSGVANCSDYFIGLNKIDGDVWQWTDGNTARYTHWNLGCPNAGPDRCVTMSTNGNWCNRNCQTQYCYICEIILRNALSTTTAPAISPDTKCQQLDIIFILDDSQSILESDFLRVIDFISNLTQLYTVKDENSNYYTQFGAVIYNDDVIATIRLNAWSNLEGFKQNLNTSSLSQPSGLTNTAAALNAAYNLTKVENGARENVPKVAILITDGRHTPILPDPRPAGEHLRERATILAIGTAGINGANKTQNVDELNQITNDPSLVFTITNNNLITIEQNIANLLVTMFPCSPIVCKGVAFLVETSELVGIERKRDHSRKIQQSLMEVLSITDTIHADDNRTVFALITFSSREETKVHFDYSANTYKTYDQWSEYLKDFADGIDKNETFEQYLQGHSYLSYGIQTTIGVLQSAKIKNPNFASATVIFAQTIDDKIEDVVNLSTSATRLRHYSRVFGINKLIESNMTRWLDVVGNNNSMLYNDYPDDFDISNVTQRVDEYVSQLDCKQPPPPSLNVCPNFMDVVFIVQRSRKANFSLARNLITKHLAPGLNINTDYLHVGIIEFDDTADVIGNNSLNRLNSDQMNMLINNISMSHQSTMVAFDSSLALLPCFIGYPDAYASITHDRKFAADVLIYISDDIERINTTSITHAANVLANSTVLLKPHVVIIAIDTNCTQAVDRFGEIASTCKFFTQPIDQSGDTGSADGDIPANTIFAIESYDYLVEDRSLQIIANSILDGICVLKPSDFPPPPCTCSSTPQTTTTTTVRPNSCPALDIDNMFSFDE